METLALLVPSNAANVQELLILSAQVADQAIHSVQLHAQSVQMVMVAQEVLQPHAQFARLQTVRSVLIVSANAQSV
jgi:hypothetical protein